MVSFSSLILISDEHYCPCYMGVNEHFVRSLGATRAREHFKLCAHFALIRLLLSYEYLVYLYPQRPRGS